MWCVWLFYQRYSSNHESYESNPFDLFYDPEFKESIGEPIIVEYRPGNNEGENGVPYNFEFSKPLQQKHEAHPTLPNLLRICSS